MAYNIFIDTEFTNFTDTELISIGLVTECGNYEFYAELPVNRKQCSEFVIDVVLPLLGQDPKAECTLAELSPKLRTWLDQFKKQSPVICFDFQGDLELFCYALNDEIPPYLGFKNVYEYLNDLKLELFYAESQLERHHALHDAKANRFAYVPEREFFEASPSVHVDEATKVQALLLRN
jgi:hypothetical protein